MALTHDIQPLGTHRCLLGESPLWHPDEAQLYCVDIPGRQVLRFALMRVGRLWPLHAAMLAFAAPHATAQPRKPTPKH